MVSRSEQIRRWLAEQDGPRTSRQIASALGFDRRPVHVMVGEMKRSGMLVAHDGNPTTFSLGRERKVWTHPSEEARLEATRASRRRYNERKAGRPILSRAEHLAQLAEKKAANDERKRKAREMAKAARKATPKKGKVRRTVTYRIPDGTPAPEVPQLRVQTVEEFLARGGKVQRLGMGEVSRPLRFIGFRADNGAVSRSLQTKKRASACRT